MKKVKLLTLVLVLAFAVTGMAYAYWTQTLAVSGTVSTGNLDLAWNGLEEFTRVEQNGDYANATIAVNPRSNKIIDVTISNAYPGWQGKFNVGYTNLGTVPGKIDSVKVVNLPRQLTLNTDGIPVGALVEYDRTITGNFLVTVRPELGNETMNETYTFSVELEGSQFNAPAVNATSPSS